MSTSTLRAVVTAGPACRDADPELFFPPVTFRSIAEAAAAFDQAEQAKALCRVCPARAACLDYALINGCDDGIFAGLDGTQRRRIRSRRGIRVQRTNLDMWLPAPSDEAEEQRRRRAKQAEDRAELDTAGWECA